MAAERPAILIDRSDEQTRRVQGGAEHASEYFAWVSERAEATTTEMARGWSADQTDRRRQLGARGPLRARPGRSELDPSDRTSRHRSMGQGTTTSTPRQSVPSTASVGAPL